MPTTASRLPRSYFVLANGATLRQEATNASPAVRRLAGGERVFGVVVQGQEIGEQARWVRHIDTVSGEVLGYVWEPMLRRVVERQGTPQHDPVDPPSPRRSR